MRRSTRPIIAALTTVVSVIGLWTGAIINSLADQYTWAGEGWIDVVGILFIVTSGGISSRSNGSSTDNSGSTDGDSASSSYRGCDSGNGGFKRREERGRGRGACARVGPKIDMGICICLRS